MSTETRVYLAQILCPQRHTILALAFEAAEMPAEALKDKIVLQTATARIHALKPPNVNTWCGLCGALESTWKTELDVTCWQSLAEAEPHLRECEREQQETVAALDRAHRQAQNN